MAAALSLHGEINNALNPQPGTPRGRALVEAIIGGRVGVTPLCLKGRKAGQKTLDGLGP